jgi:hypothetical protein
MKTKPKETEDSKGKEQNQLFWRVRIENKDERTL